jgi:hypothetical protein
MNNTRMPQTCLGATIVSKDLSQQLQSLNEYRQRAREALAPVRCEMAAWFRDFFRKKKGPARATHMNLLFVRESETPQPRWQFSWYPGMHSRDHIFTPSQAVPEFTTEVDASAMGLIAADVLGLRSCAFYDMAAEAWEQAGGFSFPKQLMIVSRAYESPDARRPWIEYMQEEIRKEVEGTRRVRPKRGFGASEPLGLPEVPGEMIEAVRNGSATALMDWADALDRDGAAEAAELLRWLPCFHALLADEVRAVSPQLGLMSAWNETHPAMEWLLRNFGFPHVAVEAIRYATDENAGTRRYDLSAGQHLGPVEEGVRVLKLDVAGWEPLEGN